MAESAITTDEQMAEDGVDGNASASIRESKDSTKSKKSKEKSTKDKSKKKGLFKMLSKSDSKDESKKVAKSKSRGETKAVEKDLKIDSTSKDKVVEDESQPSSSRASHESFEKGSNTSTEKPKKKKKSKFGVLKRKKKLKDVAQTQDAIPTGDSGSQAPIVDEQKDDIGHVSQTSQPQLSPGEDDDELMTAEKSKDISENVELEEEGTEDEHSDEHHVVSMVIQVVPRKATSNTTGKTDRDETPGDLMADESTGNEISNEAQSSPSSKPTQSAELAPMDDIPTEGETPGDAQRQDEVSGSPPLDDSYGEKPEEVKPEEFTPSGQNSDGENLEEQAVEDRLSDSMAEEVASGKHVVVEQQPGDEIPDERPSDDNGQANAVSQNSESDQENVAPKEGVSDEQASENNTAGDAVTSTEPLQSVHFEFHAKEREEKGDNEQEITEEDEEKEIEKENESELNPYENHEAQEDPGIRVEMSKSDEEITAGNLGVAEEHENDKKELEVQVPETNISSGKDDANDDTTQSEIPNTTYLSLGEDDSSEEKSCAVRKRKTDSGAQSEKSLERSGVESAVHVTKKRALFSFRNWCCTIM